MAKEARDKKEIAYAYNLLKTYLSAHPTDFNACWLYAQTAYWMKDFSTAQIFYDKATQMKPDMYFLQLDYAHTLIGITHYTKAEALLKKHIKDTGRYYNESKILLAQILFIQGRHKKAEQELNIVLQSDAQNNEAKALQYMYERYIPDTIAFVKQLRDEKNIKDAYNLLCAYTNHHPADFNACWLYAQTAYWMKDYTTAGIFYDKALQMKPTMYLLQLDYARTLIGITHYDKAQSLLVNYVNDTGRYYNESRILLAQILYTKGEYVLAKQLLETVLHTDTQNPEANALLYDIQTVLAPHVNAGVYYYADNQPLKTITPTIEAGIYKHALLAPDIIITAPLYINGLNSHVEWVQVGNQSVFRDLGIILDLHAGFIKLPSDNKTSWTANVTVSKTFMHHLAFSAQAARLPYLYTLGSIDSNIMYTKYAGSATWNNTSSWNGNATYQLSHIPGNNITSISAWGLTPPVKFSVLELRIGLAYSYSNAQADDYSADKSLASIIAGYEYTTAINGVFTPLYTPNHQNVYSGIASLTAHPIKKLTVGARVNAGYANIQVPYLFLNKNSADETFIDRAYVKEYYHPMTISAYADMALTKRLSVRAEYVYNKSYFYTSNYAGVGIKMILGNEKR